MSDNHPRPLTGPAAKLAAVFALVGALLCCGLDARAQGTTPARGFQPGGSYAVSDIETINTTNGNLMLAFPFALPAGRAGMSARLTLSYNSKLYDSFQKFEADPFVPPPPSGEPPPVERNILTPSDEGGWHYSLGYELKLINRRNHYAGPYEPQYPDDAALARWKVRMSFPDGSSREFTPRGFNGSDLLHDGYFTLRPDGFVSSWEGTGPCSLGVTCVTVKDKPVHSGTITYYSTDGTYLRLDVQHDGDADPLNNPWTLYLPNGGRVTGGGDQRIYDRNDNFVELRAVTFPNGHSGVGLFDEFGRSVKLERNSAPDEDAIHMTGFGGATLTYRIKWKAIAVGRKYLTSTQSDNGFPHTLGLLTVVSEIVLPAQAGGLSYTFGYNAPDFDGNFPLTPAPGWGELNSVTLPSGAKSSYQYTLDGRSEEPMWETVLENKPTRKELIYRLEYDGLSAVSNQPCAPAEAGCVTETWRYDVPDTTVVGPDGGVTREWVNDKRQIYKVENPDGTVVERLWRDNVPQNHPQVWFQPRPVAINAYVKTEFTSIRNANNVLVKTAVKDYEYDKNGNVTRVKEYDWVNYSAVPRDANQNPSGPPDATPVRITTNEYYTQTPDASDTTTVSSGAYYMGGSPRLRGTGKSTQVEDASQVLSRTELYYDDATTKGNVTLTRRWDSTKGLLKEPTPGGYRLDPSNSVSIANEYDDHGNPELTTDSNSVQTKVTYGPVNGFEGLYPTETRTAFGTAVQRTSATEYDFSSGLVTRSTDADNDVSTDTIYDDLGRPTLVKAAAGTADESRITTDYSDSMRRVIVRSDLHAAGDGRLVSVQHYDQLGRVRLSRRLEAETVTQAMLTDESIGVKVQTRYLYGSANSYLLASNAYRAATSAAAGGEATMGWTMTTADQGGRAVRTETFSGAKLPAPFDASSPNTTTTGAVVTSFDAETITVTDQDGKQRKSVTDALNRLVKVYEAPNASNYNYLTSYTYDALGNLVKVVQGGQTRTFDYSSLSRLTSATNPEVCRQEQSQCVPVATTYEYDANGNLKQKNDARGNEISYQYDGLNRVTKRTYSDGAPAVDYFYDSQQLPGGAPAFDRGASAGRLIAVTYGGGALGTYRGDYDALGRPRLSRQVTDAGTTEGVKTYTFSYVYDAAGNLTSETYPSGRVVRTEYDGAGRVAGVRNQAGSYYAGAAPTDAQNRIAYTASGAVSAMRLGNGLWERTQYNSRLQITQLGLGASQTDSGKLLLNYGYGTTNNNGNLLSQSITIQGSLALTQTYTYDKLNRLETAHENNDSTPCLDLNGAPADCWRQKYDYDRFGNRTLLGGADGTTYPGALDAANNPSVSAANNRINSPGYTYDEAGNLLCDPSHPCPQTQPSLTPFCAYDAENKMTKAGGGFEAGGSSYTYDGDGRRVRKAVSGGEAVVFVYDVAGRLAAEYSNVTAGGGTSYLTADALGSTRAVTDGAGQVRARRDYLPFGEEVGAGVGGRETGQGYSQADGVRQRFTQKERDGETGLDFFGARFYAPAQGRFTSCDPLMFSVRHFTNPQRWNAYVYVLNSPLSSFDPNGQDGQGEGGGRVIDIYIVASRGEIGNRGMAWKELERIAEQHSNKVAIYSLDAGTVNGAKMGASLATKNRYVIDYGHSFSDSETLPSGRVIERHGVLADYASAPDGHSDMLGVDGRGDFGMWVDGQRQDLPINAAAFMVFTCYPGSKFEAGVTRNMKEGAFFSYNDGGGGSPGKTSITTLQALERAAYAAAMILAKNGTPEEAAAAAHKIISESLDAKDLGDSIITVRIGGAKKRLAEGTNQ
ncbi:MAG TPA: RHS repeat-associated core domain-containing protein [Pyrinomonadaceae bacterium]|jgi:RHS repeat-associated protein|nr:RHS repeat-associated core domain-containing protein [Pyrinomonadaceae bacterium]